MNLNQIPWKALTALTLTVVTTAVSGCTVFTSKTQDLITQSSPNNQPLRKLSTESNSGYAVAYSPEVSRANNPVVSVLASPGAKTVKLWNPSTGKLIHTLTGHAGEVKFVAFSPDGKTLASGRQDETIKLWNVTTGKLFNSFSAQTEKVWSVAFNPDGKTLASGSQDGTIRIWQVLPK